MHFLFRAKHLCIIHVCFVALRPKSTAMVMAGRSVHLTTLFPGQAWTSSYPVLRAHTFACNWQQPFLNDSAEGRRMTVEISVVSTHRHWAPIVFYRDQHKPPLTVDADDARDARCLDSGLSLRIHPYLCLRAAKTLVSLAVCSGSDSCSGSSLLDNATRTKMAYTCNLR